MLKLILILMALFLFLNFIALAIQDYRSLKKPQDKTARGIFKSKAFWKWILSVFRCKHTVGFNTLDFKHKQCKNCGQILDR